MSEYRNTEKFIRKYDNEIPERICNEIIDLFHRRQQAGLCYSYQDKKNDLSVIERDANETTLGSNFSDDFQSFEEYIQHINTSLKFIWEKYTDEYGILEDMYPDVGNHFFKIQQTGPGSGIHKWHAEKKRMVENRVVAWTIFLNDDFEGGETEFLYQSIRVKPRIGSVLVHPADWTYTHRSNPPLNGIKYVITGWWTMI